MTIPRTPAPSPRWPSAAIPVIWLLAAAPALAQGDPPAAGQPVFRAGVELVRLDVRVTDARGRPVQDLRPEEIEVIEEGEARPLLLFQHVEEPTGSYLEVARRTIGGEISTNRGAPRGHLYVLVFDQQHISSGNEQRARLAAERFLSTQLRPGDRVAVFALPGPGPQLPFTARVDQAIAELVKVRGSLEPIELGALGSMRVYEAYEIARGNQQILTRIASELASTGADALAAIARPITAGTEDPGIVKILVQEDARNIVRRADENSRQFLLRLSDLVRELRVIEGRKVVVLFSEGFFLDNVTRELEQVAAAAAQSYSVVYAMDLNRRAVDVARAAPLGGEQFTEIQSRLEPLGALAAETDGMLVPDATAHLDEALARIARESQDYYLLGFEPSAAALTDRGSYRRVSVRVKRDDVTVRSRTGYAVGRQSLTPADRRRAIDLALTAPFPLQELPVEYTTYVLRGGTPGLQKVFVSLAAELPVAGDDDRAGPADVVFVVRSARDGRVVASGTDTLRLPEQSRSGGTTGTADYRVQFELPAGEYLMRAVVREPGGLVGSADRRLEVPALYSSRVAGSDLVLGVAAMGRLPVRTVTHADAGLTGIMQLYAPNAEALEDVAVQVELLPIGNDSPVLTALIDRVGPVDGEHGASLTIQIDVPLAGVPPGAYLTRAVARSGSEVVSERVRELTVLPGPPPPPPNNRPESSPAAFEPMLVLGGSLAQQYVSAIRTGLVEPAVAGAAALALDGRWSEIEPALGAGPSESAGYLGLRGLARFAGRRYAEAAVDLQAAFTADPKNALTAFLLGWAHAANGDDRQAIGAWRNAAYINPQLVPAHLALADAYVKLSQPALAIQALRAGLQALPDSLELRDRLESLQRREPL